MPSRNTVIRSLHDLGAAAWFGGSLMGAVGLSGAAGAVRDPHDRARVASIGWGKWSPVNAAAVGAHLVGGGALLYVNRDRAQQQGGVKANTVIKIVATGAALAVNVYNGVLGAKVAAADGPDVEAASKPAHSAYDEVAGAQRQLQYLRWTLPALTAAVVILGAQQGEQQRPPQVLTKLGSTLARRGRL